MNRLKAFLLLASLIAIFGPISRAQTINAASCNAADVQSAINAATEGQTVDIPAGTCTWASGVSISGKGIVLQGAGAGRVIGVAVTSSAVPIGTGTKGFSGVIAATVQGVLSNAQPSMTGGQTLRIIELGFLGNFMQGTVTSLSSGTLTMNITSSGGTCGATAAMKSNCKRWLITTLPNTTIIDNLSSGSMIDVTEDASFHTVITGIHFAQTTNGTGNAPEIAPHQNNSAGSCNGTGCAILIHDNFFESQNADLIDGKVNRGVIWNNSFVFSPFSLGQWAAIRVQDGNNTVLSDSWSRPSTMGTADTTGAGNLYFETNDVHADGDFTDISDDSRMVVRYNFLNNAGAATHGADTGFIGLRHFEYYNNVGLFEAYTDGTTAPMNWWMYVRGGTFAFHDNTLPQISSQDWGSKSDIVLIEQTLQREDAYPCWGAGFTTRGQYYPAPRQIGFGYVTGTGTVTYPSLGYNNASSTSNSNGYVGSVYVGDSEPAYIWNNSRTMNVGINDYGLNNGSTSCPSSPTPDSTANYVAAGRDYFNGTAKPGYTPYTYPHPLTGGQTAGQASGDPPTAPSNLTATVQ